MKLLLLRNYNHWLIKEIEQPTTILAVYNNGGRISEGTIKLGGLDQLSQIINYIEHIILIDVVQAIMQHY